jgi:hypothetical protein
MERLHPVDFREPNDSSFKHNFPFLEPLFYMEPIQTTTSWERSGSVPPYFRTKHYVNIPPPHQLAQLCCKISYIDSTTRQLLVLAEHGCDPKGRSCRQLGRILFCASVSLNCIVWIFFHYTYFYIVFLFHVEHLDAC